VPEFPSHFTLLHFLGEGIMERLSKPLVGGDQGNRPALYRYVSGYTSAEYLKRRRKGNGDSVGPRPGRAKYKAAWKQHRYQGAALPSSTAPNARNVAISAWVKPRIPVILSRS
jgi:hypothetical protein